MTDNGRKLLVAIKEGDSASAKMLLGEEPAAATARDMNGVSLLMLALYHGQTEIAGLIREAHPGPDPFEAAALGETDRIASLLVQGDGAVNDFSADGFTTLGYACFFGQAEAAKLLLEGGADPNAVSENPMKVFPINSAAARKRADIVALLLDHGADVNAAQQGGYTALHSAAHNGDLATIRILLERGADPSPVADDGRTPLQMAEADGHEEAAGLLQT